MTYEAQEHSIQDGAPVYRFQFSQGAVDYYYTSAAYFISDSNGTWEPLAIKSSDVTQSGDMVKDPLSISVPRDCAIALSFLGGSPDQITTLTVFRSHSGDPHDEFQVYWKGRVTGSKAEGDTVSLNCENIFTSLRRSGLRAKYQRGCRHALYSSQCGLSLAAFAEAVIITAVNGFALTAAAASGFDDGYFSGGIIQADDGSLRYVSKHEGSVITLMSPLGIITSQVAASGTASVNLYPGCAHNMAACETKFSNLQNYGGFPWLPSKNPFSNTITGSIA